MTIYQAITLAMLLEMWARGQLNCFNGHDGLKGGEIPVAAALRTAWWAALICLLRAGNFW